MGIYLIWLTACFGTLSRAEFVPVINAGGNTGDLVSALQAQRGSIEKMLGIFSNFAIITSFLGIGLGLFDFLADRLSLDNSGLDRMKTALCAFLPPAVFSAIYPKGFVIAIGYLGLVVTFSFFLVPAIMAIRNRANESDMSYRVFGGNALLYLMLIFSVVVMLCKVLAMFGMLPTYP